MKTSCNGLNWTRYKVNFTVETLANVRVYLSLLANVSITKPILLLLPNENRLKFVMCKTILID